MIGFIVLRFHETHGRWPFMKAKQPATPVDDSESHTSSTAPKNQTSEKTTTVST